MTVKIIKGREVTRPDTTPLTSSVLDHATLATNAQFGMTNDAGLWPSYNCVDTLVPTAICPDPLAPDVFKTFSFGEWMPGFAFAMQGGVQCRTVGLDKADQKAEIERVFEANEGKGVEQALLGNRFVATDSDAEVQWDAPVDLTPASPVALSLALAILEGYAASVYAGLPTIHMPRAVASILNERIVWDGDKAYTRSGAKVAIGGGYDSDGVPTGTYDMYVTGEVYVERSDTISIQQYVLPGDGSGVGSDENGLPDNTVVALVERMYRVGIDCFVAKITGTAWT